MKTEASSTLRKVWAMKQAAERETRGLSAQEYFRHIRRRLPKLDLPVAPRRSRPMSGSRAK